MSKKRKNKKIKKIRKIFQQKIASKKEELLAEVEIENRSQIKEEKVTKIKKREGSVKKRFRFLKIDALSLIEKYKIPDFGKKKENFRVSAKTFLERAINKSNIYWARFINVLKNSYYKIKLIFGKCNTFLCTGLTSKTNLKRDIIIFTIAILASATFLGMGQYVDSIKKKIEKREPEMVPTEKLIDQFEEENAKEIEIIQEKIDISQWKNFQSSWYGFKISYPQAWKNPYSRPYNRNSKAIYRMSFLSNNENANFLGFDVAIYDINKIKELSGTDEFPKLKSDLSEDANNCPNIEGHVLETGDYPAEEIYIPQGDSCYDSTLFFTTVDGQYIYNIVPRKKDEIMDYGDLMVSVSDNLPEFFSAVSSFENIDIVRPKPKPIQPKITAPKPASYKVVGGRLVCEKSNDKPSKSKQNKKKHMDMECCLDPDEYPNPNCYYDSNKYGKYLK